VLDAAFPAPEEAWAAGIRETDGSLAVARSGDGGALWQVEVLPEPSGSSGPPTQAYLTVLNEDTAWLALRLASGSAFSPGRLYFSEDGGRSWEERSLPIGAPVTFQDADRGWVAGGPSGDRLYATRDGGRTWAPETLKAPPGAAITLGQLHFEPGEGATLPVLLAGPDGTEGALYAPTGEGQDWRLVPGARMGPDELDDRLLAAGARDLPTGAALPLGTIRLDFLDEAHGWALVRDGHCQGEKGAPTGGESGFICQEQWLLLATADGGKTWRELPQLVLESP
jgi:photosystem II stability/assembly factor-like uncharacterized protein